VDPGQIQRWLDGNMWKLDGPEMFLGDEPGSVRKPWDSASVRVLLAASWPYMQAAGNNSIPVVYRAINDHPASMCDRFYLPATPRDFRLLEKGGLPVFGVESKHGARDFDVLATSVSYTVLFVNFCEYLRVSGIPLRWRDRQACPEKYPMVMVGGQAFCAPEFMAPAVDCVFLGEAEDEPGNPGIQAVCAVIAEMKQSGDWQNAREYCYKELAREFNFLYFPRHVEFSYKYEDRGLPELTKMVAGVRCAVSGIGTTFKARRVQDLDAIKPYTEAPLLYSDPGMGAGDIEAARGCPAWCSFCRLSWVTKPYREHSVGYLVKQAAEWRRNMGSNELSPYGPDFPMYTRKKELLGSLLENVSDEVDTGAMRVDDFIGDPDYSMLLAFGGTDAVTLGLEGNSQRMRDLVGKGVSDADVKEAVARAIRAGIRKVKLFMISNMPGEEAGDVMRIVRLGRELADLREQMGQPGVRIQFSWTPLLIEAQTPMQWFAPTAPDYTLQQAMAELREHRVEMKLGAKAQAEKIALFQACQRASRDAGEAIVDVMDGLRAGSWGGVAKDMRERLDAALVARGFRNGLDDLWGERYKDDLLGWEHIDTGVSKDLMWDAYQHMVTFLEGTDAEGYDRQFDDHYRGGEWIARCDQHCSGKACGCCDKKDLEIRQEYIRATDRDLGTSPVRPLDQTTVACKVRFRFERTEAHRFVSNAHWKFAIRRAAYRAQAEGFPAIAKRSIRLASDAYQYRDRSAGADYAEFGLTAAVAQSGLGRFMDALARELRGDPGNPWLLVQDYQVFPKEAALPRTPVSFWELEVAEGAHALAQRLREYDASEHVRVLIRQDSFYSGESAEEANAKDHIADAWAVRAGDRMLLRMILNGKLGPYQAYAPLIGRASWLEAMRFTARRLAFFDGADVRQGSLLRPACAGCGAAVPAGLLGEVPDVDYCPRCRDEAAGAIAAGLAREGVSGLRE
jgi:radical SAM superfamily enzyme YgiQ (UPF0313 family)